MVCVTGSQEITRDVSALRSKDNRLFSSAVTPNGGDVTARSRFCDGGVATDPYGTHPTYTIIAAQNEVASRRRLEGGTT